MALFATKTLLLLKCLHRLRSANFYFDNGDQIYVLVLFATVRTHLSSFRSLNKFRRLNEVLALCYTFVLYLKFLVFLSHDTVAYASHSCVQMRSVRCGCYNPHVTCIGDRSIVSR